MDGYKLSENERHHCHNPGVPASVPERIILGPWYDPDENHEVKRQVQKTAFFLISHNDGDGRTSRPLHRHPLCTILY